MHCEHDIIITVGMKGESVFPGEVTCTVNTI